MRMHLRHRALVIAETVTATSETGPSLRGIHETEQKPLHQYRDTGDAAAGQGFCLWWGGFSVLRNHMKTTLAAPLAAVVNAGHARPLRKRLAQ